MTSHRDEKHPGEGGGLVERLTLVLDLVGSAALILGAFVVWAPLALFVLGALSLAASRHLSPRSDEPS